MLIEECAKLLKVPFYSPGLRLDIMGALIAPSPERKAKDLLNLKSSLWGLSPGV